VKGQVSLDLVVGEDLVHRELVQFTLLFLPGAQVLAQLVLVALGLDLGYFSLYTFDLHFNQRNHVPENQGLVGVVTPPPLVVHLAEDVIVEVIGEIIIRFGPLVGLVLLKTHEEIRHAFPDPLDVGFVLASLVERQQLFLGTLVETLDRERRGPTELLLGIQICAFDEFLLLHQKADIFNRSLMRGILVPVLAQRDHQVEQFHGQGGVDLVLVHHQTREVYDVATGGQGTELGPERLLVRRQGVPLGHGQVVQLVLVGGLAGQKLQPVLGGRQVLAEGGPGGAQELHVALDRAAGGERIEGQVGREVRDRPAHIVVHGRHGHGLEPLLDQKRLEIVVEGREPPVGADRSDGQFGGHDAFGVLDGERGLLVHAGQQVQHRPDVAELGIQGDELAQVALGFFMVEVHPQIRLGGPDRTLGQLPGPGHDALVFLFVDVLAGLLVAVDVIQEQLLGDLLVDDRGAPEQLRGPGRIGILLVDRQALFEQLQELGPLDDVLGLGRAAVAIHLGAQEHLLIALEPLDHVIRGLGEADDTFFIKTIIVAEGVDFLLDLRLFLDLRGRLGFGSLDRCGRLGLGCRALRQDQQGDEGQQSEYA